MSRVREGEREEDKSLHFPAKYGAAKPESPSGLQRTSHTMQAPVSPLSPLPPLLPSPLSLHGVLSGGPQRT